jgi:hypothetical protein
MCIRDRDSIALKSNIASPTFTGTPAAPTASVATNTTQVATTAFVAAEVAALVDSAPGTLNTLNELAAALGDDANYASTITAALALKAPIASPTFTGTVAIPNISDLETAVTANTTKVTNVSTDLGITTSTTTVIITSSDGTNATIPVATTSVGGVMSKAIFDKLDGIEASATADQSNAEIVAAVEAGTDSNTFTDADHSKLDGIEASADVTDTTNVVAALTAGTNVTISVGGTIASTDTTYSEATGLAEGLMSTAHHDKLDGIETSATADQTNAEIRTAVEAATDSNVFTDADHSKLNAIEASATADQDKADIDGLAITTVGAIDSGSWTATDIAVAHGGTGASSAGDARTNLGVDAAGTDNSTSVTLVTSSHDYLSISTQAITLGTIDISDDTNLAAGTGITLTGDTLSVDAAQTQITSVGTLTSVVVADGGNIGSASDTDAISIASTGTVTFTKVISVPVSSTNVPSGSNPNKIITLNVADANFFRVQLAASDAVTAINFTDAAIGQKFIIRIEQPASGTVGTVTWEDVDAPDATGAVIYWPGGTAPTLTAANSKADVVGFMCIGKVSTTFYFDAFIIGQNM